MRALQEKYFQQLQSIGTEVQAHVFPFNFYLSRVLDLELAQQERADQRSLRFDVYGGRTVVELTGNYFAVYSADSVDKSHRALRTFQDVMMPILEIAMPILADNPDVQGFAMEISHRVGGKAMGVHMQRPENLVLVLPKDAALRLASGKSEKDRQAALLDGQFFVNAEPFILYLSDHAAEDSTRDTPESPGVGAGDRNSAERSKASLSPGTNSVSRGFPRPTATEPPPAPPRDTSPESLAKVQASYQKMIDLVVKELDSQAHFVTYAPPAMVAFRKQIFLEFSLQTPVAGNVAGSRYKLAALAFDDHVAHLVRPMMAYFKGDLDFDGIAFSTTVSRQEKAAKEQGAEAIEFFLPTAALRCYETYDCTGQQLINEGFVLINGERVTLDLQTAESAANW